MCDESIFILALTRLINAPTAHNFTKLRVNMICVILDTKRRSWTQIYWTPKEKVHLKKYLCPRSSTFISKINIFLIDPSKFCIPGSLVTLVNDSMITCYRKTIRNDRNGVVIWRIRCLIHACKTNTI